MINRRHFYSVAPRRKRKSKKASSNFSRCRSEHSTHQAASASIQICTVGWHQQPLVEQGSKTSKDSPSITLSLSHQGPPAEGRLCWFLDSFNWEEKWIMWWFKTGKSGPPLKLSCVLWPHISVLRSSTCITSRSGLDGEASGGESASLSSFGRERVWLTCSLSNLSLRRQMITNLCTWAGPRWRHINITDKSIFSGIGR